MGTLLIGCAMPPPLPPLLPLPDFWVMPCCGCGVGGWWGVLVGWGGCTYTYIDTHIYVLQKMMYKTHAMYLLGPKRGDGEVVLAVGEGQVGAPQLQRTD